MSNQGNLLEAEAAAYVGVKSQTLAKWRIRNFGPPFLRLSSKIFYQIEDLNTWVQSCRVVPTELKPKAIAPRRSHHKHKAAA